MKKAVILISLFFVIFSHAQQKKDASGIPGMKLTQDIVITYDGVGSKLSGSGEIVLEALVDRSDESPLLIEIPMEKEGDLWKCRLRVDDPKSLFVIYRYVSGDNKDEDKMGQYIVLDNDGKPAEGAHLAAGNFYLTGRLGDYRRQADLEKAKKEFAMEKKLFPKSWKASMALIDVALREKSDERRTKKALDDIYKNHKTDQEALSLVIDLYQKAGDSAKALKIKEEAIKSDPRGKIAQSEAANIWMKEKEPAKRAILIENFLNEFPGMENQLRQSSIQSLARAHLQGKDYEKGAEAISRLEKPNPGLYNSVAWPLIEKGEKLETAVELARKGIDILRSQTIDSKPSYMRKKDWDENNRYTLAMLLDTYGTGLLKLGRNDEALGAYQEAYEKSEGLDPEMNLNYLKALVKNQMHDRTIDLGLEFIRKGKDSPDIQATMKEAYCGMKGRPVFDSLSQEERGKFDEMIAEASKIKIEEMKKKIVASRINADAPQFTLKDMNGVPVSLSSLKGKVVIVDFWATWCGPCKSSFPYLQKVFEKYQKNEQVMFLAVNSWERQKNYDDQLQNAKKFIEENKYTFPVLIDEKMDDQYKVIGDYDVEGIPTKFLISKSGSIAFKSVGFDGPSMEDELTQQIEILLAE